MIKTWRHAGLQSYFETGSKAGTQPVHANKLTKLLTALNVASKPQDMAAPAWRLHPLKGDLAGHWSVDVNGNYRITFKFEGTDAVLVDYRDTH
ncbi:MAG TPA: type II toxin-antitoxin system RelE/ParE family toxin [Steroidobacteraceae bacterium]